jgi:hypothetical protein
MSTHPLPDFLLLWAKGELTSEQAIGHLLQHLYDFYQWRAEIEKRLRQLEQAPPEPR